MATSGRVGSGGFSGGSYFYFQWQLAGQTANYSTINWQWGLYIAPGGWYWGSNAIKSLSGYINGGQAFGANTWSNLSGTGDHQLLAGSWNIEHDPNGTKVFGISSTGYSFGDGNFSNSGNWDLPTIARHSYITNASGDTNDENPNPWVEFANPAGTAVDVYLDLPNLGIGGIARRYNVGSRYTWTLTTAELNQIRSALTNTNSTIVRYVVHDSLGGDNWTWIDRALSMDNANPTFSNFTYKDIYTGTVAITGNDQYLIQGWSAPLVTVSSGNKATANKQATMSRYTVTIGGFSDNVAYSTSTVTIAPGNVPDVNGAQQLSVKAVDSRGNSTTVSKTVNVLPYAVPVVNATATRANGFDDALVLHVVGSISPLRIGTADKNTINTTSGVQYRVSVDGAAYGSWTNLASTQTAVTGVITGNSDPVIAAAGSASSDHSYTIQVKIIDKLTETIQTVGQSAGTAIFKISDKNTGAISGPGSVYYKGKLLDTLLIAGPTGATGPAGTPGGATGPTGAIGRTGATGPAGATGAGATGAAGPSGATGPQGATGTTGATGASGVLGRTGPTGVQGSTGPTGVAGFVVQPTAPLRTDVLWVDSDDNSATQPGATGATGAAGSPGGATGPSGPSGPSGPLGPTGPTGAAGVIVQTSAPANTGVIWVDSDDSSPSEPGATGATGPAGSPGGATGATGPAGTNGATGVAGTAGATGPQGATGVAGANGATGPVGATGAAGAPTPRVGTTTSSASPTINTNNYDQYNITAQAANIVSMSTNLSGTPVSGQKLMLRIKDNGTTRTIAWGASFQSSGVATLLTTTVAGKTHHIGFIYDDAVSKWICIAADATGY
jgi:hypothetical protein